MVRLTMAEQVKESLYQKERPCKFYELHSPTIEERIEKGVLVCLLRYSDGSALKIDQSIEVVK